MDDPDADLTLVDALAQLTFAVHAALAAVADAHDLSITQLRLLGILRDREPLMADLARFLGLERSSVTGLVDRAQRRGLVERVDAEHDGRAVHVRLTRAGRRAGRTLERDANAAVAALAEGLSAADQARLARLAGRIVARAGAS